MHLSGSVVQTTTRNFENNSEISFEVVPSTYTEGTLEYKTYGILAATGEESLLIEDISDERNLVICLCRRLKEGNPKLYQLRDIVEDYLVDWPFICADELKKNGFCDKIG